MSAASRVAVKPGASASHDRVDVWQVVLDGRGAAAAELTLCDAERAHAARLLVGAARWIASRAGLRRVLGSYLGLAPEAVELESGPNGKPRLVAGGSVDLRFSLSHSEGLALIAVRLGHEVGIDVERVRAGVDGAAIERDVFGSAGGDAGSGEEFFRRWARREALAKASGRGIASAAPAEAAGFRIVDLEGIPGYSAALASEGPGWRLRTMAAGSLPLWSAPK